MLGSTATIPRNAAHEKSVLRRLVVLLIVGLWAAAGCSGEDSPPASTSNTDSAATAADAASTATDGGSASDISSSDISSSGRGSSDAAASTNGCGATTDLGACSGTVLSWCDGESKLQSEDCKTYFGVDQPGACTEIDASQGHFCAALSGDPCLTELDDGEVVAEYCVGHLPACIYGKADAVCTDNFFTCTDEDIGTCKNNFAIWDCNLPQPTATDCGSFAAKCAVVDAVAVCSGVVAGGDCDDYDVFCADGLTCEGVSETSWGTCTKK